MDILTSSQLHVVGVFMGYGVSKISIWENIWNTRGTILEYWIPLPKSGQDLMGMSARRCWRNQFLSPLYWVINSRICNEWPIVPRSNLPGRERWLRRDWGRQRRERGTHKGQGPPHPLNAAVDAIHFPDYCNIRPIHQAADPGRLLPNTCHLGIIPFLGELALFQGSAYPEESARQSIN